MKLYSILLLLLLALPPLARSGAPADGPLPAALREFEKKLSKSYPIHSTGTVDISNLYGSIVVRSWDRPEVKMDVRIVTRANSAEAAEVAWDRIAILFNSTGPERVIGATEIQPERSVSGWLFKSINVNYAIEDTKIYWTVHLPATVNFVSEARYCNVTLPDLDGRNDLAIKYGNLDAGKLSGNTTIDLSYGNGRVNTLGDNSSIHLRYGRFDAVQVGDFRYDGRYSRSQIDRAGKLRLDIGYENVTVGRATSIYLDGSYNSLTAGEVGELEIDGNYGSYSIELVTRGVKIDARYGDIEIDRVAAGFEYIDIETGYIDVELKIDPAAGYSVDLETTYGDIDMDDSRLANRERQREGQTSHLRGTVAGRGNGRVHIETRYGDIEIE